MTAYTITTHEVLVGQPFTLLEIGPEEYDTLTITADGTLEQTGIGVPALVMQLGTQLANSGSILGTNIGVSLHGGALVDNRAGGLIQASDAAIEVIASGSYIYNSLAANIHGGTTGIRLSKAEGVIQNHGIITGKVAVHVMEDATPGGRVALINTGHLTSTVDAPGAYAVRLNGAVSSEFHNQGFVTGAVHVFAFENAYIANSGVIRGDVFLHTHNASGVNTYIASGFGWAAGTIYTGDNDSLLVGGARDDRFVGAHGDDTIIGGEGNDVINGQWGHNVLEGGYGSDQIFAWGSQDRIVYKNAAESPLGRYADTIRGFDLLDVIDLRQVPGSSDRIFRGTRDFLNTGQFQVRVDSGGGAHHISVDINGDTFRDMLIILHRSHFTLNAAHFLL